MISNDTVSQDDTGPVADETEDRVAYVYINYQQTVRIG